MSRDGGFNDGMGSLYHVAAVEKTTPRIIRPGSQFALIEVVEGIMDCMILQHSQWESFPAATMNPTYVCSHAHDDDRKEHRELSFGFKQLITTAPQVRGLLLR